MIRVIGNFQFRAPKNNSVKAFVQWLSKFEGCQFTSEDWKHFRNKVIERKVYYNREVKYGGYMIGVHFSLGQICVSCGNGNGVPASQLFITVIPVKSGYNHTLGEAVEYDSPADGDEEGGES